nr:unnamed protein product [Callosobruchus analis]
MPRLCCVPRCKSNYKSTLKMEALQTTFSFPKEANLRMRWLKAIHRDNYTVTKNSVVCCKHFDEDEITRHEVFKDKDGTSQGYPLARLKLKEGSVPHIFENLPKYMSVSIPKVRRDPQQRKEDCLQRKDKQIENFLNSDLIADFDTFKEHVQHKVVFKNWSLKVAGEVFYFFLLNVDCRNDFEEGVKVINSIIIQSDMTIRVFIQDTELSDNNLRWILPDGRLHRWSQIENLLARYNYVQSISDLDLGSNSHIVKAHKHLVSAISTINEENDKDITTLELIADQLALISAAKKNYSVSTLIFLMAIFNQSSSTYEHLRDYLTLPTSRRLKQITSEFNISPIIDKSRSKSYLWYAASNLSDREKIVCLLIDEIYIKTGLQYKAKNVTGFAENNPTRLAKTVQTFMISSAFSNFKEVVRLVPANNMPAEELSQIVLNVINYVQTEGFKVLCVITDNNRVNQKLFRCLCKNSIFFPNPSYPSEQIFTLYDFVHIFKNIYHNWKNLKNFEHTFLYPNYNNFDIQEKASFAHLRSFYQEELQKVTKRAYKLNNKTLFPNNLERQSVMLANNVFHDSTIAALNTCHDYKCTVEFLQLVRDWWSIINVKNILKGIHKRNPLMSPIIP